MARVLEPIAACPDDERLAFEISKRHAFSLREAMSFGNGQHIRFFEENPSRKFRGAFIEDREYRVELLFSEHLDQLLNGRITHLDHHMRVGAREGAEKLGNLAAGERLQHANS